MIKLMNRIQKHVKSKWSVNDLKSTFELRLEKFLIKKKYKNQSTDMRGLTI